jgi:hypothetical protein
MMVMVCPRDAKPSRLARISKEMMLSLLKYPGMKIRDRINRTGTRMYGSAFVKLAAMTAVTFFKVLPDPSVAATGLGSVILAVLLWRRSSTAGNPAVLEPY